MMREPFIHFLITFAVMVMALLLLGFIDPLWLRLLLAVGAGTVAALISRAVLRRGPADPSDARRSSDRRV